MTDTQVFLIERSIGQVEREGSRFTQHFMLEIGEMDSIASSEVWSCAHIDPLQFLLSACDHFKRIETAEERIITVDFLPSREQFNLAANAMLRALAKTLGSDLSANVREAWINVFRTIAEREQMVCATKVM